MANLNKKEGGWVLKWIVIIFAIILVLSFLGFDIKKFMNSDMTTGNLQYMGEFLLSIWIQYLKPLYDFVINITSPFFQVILNFLSKIGNGGSIGIK